MTNIVTALVDGFQNIVANLGTSRDKASHSVYAPNILADDQIAYAYDYAWLPRKIVDIPAFDSVRAWRDWQAEADQITLIEAEEKRLGLQQKVLQAKIKARLWGGAAILIGTGESDLSKPLEPARITTGGIKYLTVMSRRELTAGEIELDPASEFYGQPKTYTVRGQRAQLDIHPSRLAIFHGAAKADRNLSITTYSGWGDSVLQSVMDAVKQADNTAANIASLVFEAKVDVFKIPGFAEGLASGGEAYEASVLRRLSLGARAKGINGAILLDGEEDYQSKSAGFASLPEILDRFLQIVSGAADIPATRLLSQAPAGMNATGESDLRNYYDRLSAMQAIETTPAMNRLDECLIRSALGSRPPELHFNWAPLWQLSEKEKADVFKTKADAARTLIGTGGASPRLLPLEALSKALTNELIEDGSLSGLEAAIEEFGALEEQEPDEGDDEDAAGGNVTQLRQAANDAAPRTLYVRRNLVNAEEFIAWAKSQGFEATVPAEELHVTLITSETPVDWMEMGNASEFGNDDGELTIPPGGPRVVEPLGTKGGVVLLFSSWELGYRHGALLERGATDRWPDYVPHVTITYSGPSPDLSKVEPYRGKLVFGPEIFEEVNLDWTVKES